jgi:pyruvate dehydrogenase E2 component (dihydrolipoamide acetyltransferase)
MDVESYDDGFLAVIVVKEGEVATVGEPVAYIAATAAEIPAVQAYVAGGGGGGAAAAAPAAAAPVAAVHAPAAAAAVTSAAVVNTGRVEASPFAKVQAKEQGIDLTTVTPTRADGLITARDLAGTAATLGKY